MAPAPRTSFTAPASSEGADAPSARPRPALLWALLHGLLAAAGPLVLAGVLGLLGWYLSDAGAHGHARDGIRAGAVGWLVGHGSGFTVDGVAVTVVPLLVTGAIAWWVWRSALALGERLWGHGPDLHRLGDGERDWTVPVAVLGFALAYLGTVLVVLNLVSGPSFAPRVDRVVLWTLALVVLVAAPGVATGSGRAATWTSQLPAVLRHAVSTARRVVVWWLVTCLVLVVASLGLGLGDALDSIEALGLSGGEAAQLLVLNLAYLPNAVLLAGAFLLGPGFTVGAGTVVAPAGVTLGPLPLVPLAAALPGEGQGPLWWVVAAAVPVLAAALAAWRHQRERPTLRWDEGALRGCGAGLGAAAVVALLTSLSGGALGPGRLRDLGADAGAVGLHGIVWFGLGALLGGLVITWWQRRTSVPVEEVDRTVRGDL